MVEMGNEAEMDVMDYLVHRGTRPSGPSWFSRCWTSRTKRRSGGEWSRFARTTWAKEWWGGLYKVGK